MPVSNTRLWLVVWLTLPLALNAHGHALAASELWLAARRRLDEAVASISPHTTPAGLARLGDARGLYPRLSARENIVYYGGLQGLSAAGAEARPAGSRPWCRRSQGRRSGRSRSRGTR